MVAIPACPTPQPAGAACYRWAKSSDTSLTLKDFRGLLKSTQGQKPAKSLAPQRRRGSVQRSLAAAPVRHADAAAAPVGLVLQPDRPHTRSFARCVVLLLLRATSDGISPPEEKPNNKYRRAR